MSPSVPRSLLPIALALGCVALAPPASAREDDRDEDSRLPTVVVSALGLSEDEAQVAAPYSLVEGEAILERGHGTLGDALDGLPGVHSEAFGGGASRPVIRGQSAPRVKVLSDGVSVLDASDISPDHAISADPLLLQRVEVLRGPATLLYGSGAVGGVVNLLDNKVPATLPEDGVDGMVALRANSVANERAGAAALTAALGDRFAVHAGFSRRDADDYRVPDREERRVDGSFAESANASLGLSWIGDHGHLGLAYSQRDDDYGLPGHSHGYDACHPHGTELHCGGHDHDGHDHGDDDDDHGHDHDHEDPPTIDLLSRRFDLRGELNDPFIGIRRIRLRASHTDYRHHEREHGLIATTFRNQGQDARVEVEHTALGRWTGVFGLQHADTTFAAEGVEAFLPTVDTRSTGLFVVEHLDLSEQWHFELGARREWLRHRPVDDPRNRPAFDAATTSLSGAAMWSFHPDHALSLSLARSERAPHAQELYARGLHLATNTYECGLYPSAFTCGGSANDALPGIETSRNVELSVRRTHGLLTWEIGAFLNKVDDYVHARTLDRHEDFRLIKYSQSDVKFRGLEAEFTLKVSDAFSASVFGDRVRASFADGSGNLPRIPASRLGLRLNGVHGDLSGELEFYSVARQTRIADHESATPGYDMLNLGVNYALGRDKQLKVFLRASNLLDKQAFNHASFLAEVVPLPGRNVSVGLRYAF
ncbi:MAG: TonB-dependent receptor [Lysobacteraceae bacterium]